MSHTRRQTHRIPSPPAKGFSLVELVTVLVIVGALAAFAVPKLATNFSGFQQYAFRQDVLTAVRYAQKTASAASCEIQVQLDGGADEVSLRYDDPGDCADPDNDNFNDMVPNPTGGDFRVSATGGASLETTGTIVFDQFGGHRSGDTLIEFANADSIHVNDITGYAR